MKMLHVVVMALVAALVASLIVSIPVYFLWNGCLVGAIDGVKEITWLQGWGLMVLFNIVTKTSVEFKK